MYFPLCYFLPGLLDWLCFHVHSHLCCFLLCPRCHIFSLKCQMMCYSSFPSLFVPCEFSPVPFISVSLCFPLYVFLAFTFPVQDRGTEYRERGRIEPLPSLMSVSCPGHLLLSHLNSWDDDDVDPCWCSQLPLHWLGSAVRKSMQQPCKSTVLLKVIGAGQRVRSAVTSVLQHAIWRCDSLQVFPLYQHFSKIILESGHLFLCVSVSPASILPRRCYLCKNHWLGSWQCEHLCFQVIALRANPVYTYTYCIHIHTNTVIAYVTPCTVLRQI